MPLTKKERALRTIASQVRRCRKCPLAKGRERAVPGEGAYNAKVFFVGEAPGKGEDEQGRPFVGQAGKILNEVLERSGLTREEVFITSILKCRPPKNRNPRAQEMTACRPYLKRQINVISPKVLVSLGAFGLKGLTGKSGKISDIRRRKLDFEGTPIIATYHPAAVLYNRKLVKKIVNDLRKATKLS
ncbi:MAG: uracil-DNA glycosylase [Thermoplasmata archaeon]